MRRGHVGIGSRARFYQSRPARSAAHALPGGCRDNAGDADLLAVQAGARRGCRGCHLEQMADRVFHHEAGAVPPVTPLRSAERQQPGKTCQLSGIVSQGSTGAKHGLAVRADQTGDGIVVRRTSAPSRAAGYQSAVAVNLAAMSPRPTRFSRTGASARTSVLRSARPASGSACPRHPGPQQNRERVRVPFTLVAVSPRRAVPRQAPQPWLCRRSFPTRPR
jgi:hypothetical protein